MSENELRDEIVKIQNEIQSIDAQLSERKALIESVKDNNGYAPKEEYGQYLDWKRRATRAKQCMMTKLRELKSKLRQIATADNSKCYFLAQYISNKLPVGSIHKYEDGFFGFSNDDWSSDEYEDLSDLIEAIKEKYPETR